MEDYLLSEMKNFVSDTFSDRKYVTISVDSGDVFLFVDKNFAIHLHNTNGIADFNEITKKYEEVKDRLGDRLYDYTEFMAL